MVTLMELMSSTQVHVKAMSDIRDSFSCLKNQFELPFNSLTPFFIRI